MSDQLNRRMYDRILNTPATQSPIVDPFLPFLQRLAHSFLPPPIPQPNFMPFSPYLHPPISFPNLSLNLSMPLLSNAEFNPYSPFFAIHARALISAMPSTSSIGSVSSNSLPSPISRQSPFSNSSNSPFSTAMNTLHIQELEHNRSTPRNSDNNENPPSGESSSDTAETRKNYVWDPTHPLAENILWKLLCEDDSDKTRESDVTHGNSTGSNSVIMSPSTHSTNCTSDQEECQSVGVAVQKSSNSTEENSEPGSPSNMQERRLAEETIRAQSEEIARHHEMNVYYDSEQGINFYCDSGDTQTFSSLQSEKYIPSIISQDQSSGLMSTADVLSSVSDRLKRNDLKRKCPTVIDNSDDETLNPSCKRRLMEDMIHDDNEDDHDPKAPCSSRS